MLDLIKQDKIKNEEWEKTIDIVKAIYYFIIGGRNGRKSTKIQLKMLKKYFKKKTKFILLIFCPQLLTFHLLMQYINFCRVNQFLF